LILGLIIEPKLKYGVLQYPCSLSLSPSLRACENQNQIRQITRDLYAKSCKFPFTAMCSLNELQNPMPQCGIKFLKYFSGYSLYLIIHMSTLEIILYRVQLLLWNRRINNGAMQTVSRQQIVKHVPAATNTHTTIELLLEAMFSTRSAQSGYKEDSWGDPVSCQLTISLWR
jgi:hypothetical protein